MQSASGPTFSIRRINESILASRERQLLDAVAARLPPWVSSDSLTMLGVLGGAITGISCFATHLNTNFLYIAVLGEFINWFGDSLDGSLARFRGTERRIYGPFVDQYSDMASHFMIMFGLGLSPLMHLSTALMGLLGSMLVKFYDLVKLPSSGVEQISHLGWGPTEMRLLIVTCFLFAAWFGQPSFSSPVGVVTMFDVVGLTVFAVALFGVAGAFWIDRSRIAEMDPLRDSWTDRGGRERDPVGRSRSAL
jgi:archaetidylinositol phosphate synthase